jgi:hypothetical protein
MYYKLEKGVAIGDGTNFGVTTYNEAYMEVIYIELRVILQRL